MAEERPLVAGLRQPAARGMRLQTDPAVIYGITRGRGVLGRGLKACELEKDTPYNTYVHKGLPPGRSPIPGAAAIEAAVHPAQSDYIYFVADGSGGHEFAATLAEHNENVEPGGRSRPSGRRRPARCRRRRGDGAGMAAAATERFRPAGAGATGARGRCPRAPRSICSKHKIPSRSSP